MRPRTNLRSAAALLGPLLAVCLLPAGRAQQPKAQPQTSQPKARQRAGEYTLAVDVDYVVLHTSVTDSKGRVVPDLKRDNFRILEDNSPQEISKLLHEDVPVTVGLVLDNSGSMTENKPAMSAGAVRFAATSNPRDELFVVNFKDDYYLDLPPGKDFTSDVEELKEALGKTSTSGNTAVWDAISASLQHLERGTHQKKVLLVITDGVDSTSSTTFLQLLLQVQRAEAAIYFIALPWSSEIKRGERRAARRNMQKLADASGGLAHFIRSPDGSPVDLAQAPITIAEVEALCAKIARDIRNQYILTYYPTNQKRDGSFRAVRVEVVNPPRGFGKLYVRARTGYYAARERGSSN